jgi:hypothetical protein
VESIPGIQDNALMKKETLFVYSIIWFITSGAPGLTVGEIVKIYRYFLKMARIEIYFTLWIIFTRDGRRSTSRTMAASWISHTGHFMPGQRCPPGGTGRFTRRGREETWFSGKKRWNTLIRKEE